MEYMGTSEAAKRWGVSQARVSQACRDKKIENAEQDAPYKPWRIPIDAKNPFKKEARKAGI